MLNPATSPGLLRISKKFRKNRNKDLSELIEKIYSLKKEKVLILDVGGLPNFWKTVTCKNICNIFLLNKDPSLKESLVFESCGLNYNLIPIIGDAMLLPFKNSVFDLVVCNSVLEHLKTWNKMRTACHEMTRTGKRGWVQIPAFEFPIEVHFLLPFIHYFSIPLQIYFLKKAFRRFKAMEYGKLADICESVKPQTKHSLLKMFEKPVHLRSEKFLLLKKSHIIKW